MTNYRPFSLFDPASGTNKPWILVATPFSELGEIICDSLKEVAQIDHIQSVAQGIFPDINHPDYSQVILDMEFGELNVLNLGKSLRLLNPAIRILIISKDEKPTDLDEILPWEFLAKPLLLRDLEAALGISENHADLSGEFIDLDGLENDNNGEIRWSKDARMATRYLGNLIEKSFAQEALLIQNGAVWSYAGRLSEESVLELNRLVQKNIDDQNNYDFSKFIKLETTQTEYALYASLIFVGFILALVFNPDIPFGTIRKETKNIAKTLLLLDGSDIPAKSLASGSVETNARIEGKPTSNKWNSSEPTGLNDSRIGISTSISSRNIPHYAPPPSRAALTIKEQIPEKDSPAPSISPWPAIKPSSFVNEIRVMEDGPDYKHEESDNIQISFLHEFIPDALYNLSYSCLLIPRFASPSPSGDREEMIEGYMKNIHVSYGWRLEQLEVQPDYLRWISSFPPNITPSKHIERIRKETSRLLFEDFPTLKRENLNNDYWAPGYLIVGGKNSISNQLVMAFLRRNRMKHGINLAVPGQIDLKGVSNIHGIIMKG
jgi:putative transposase